MKNIHQYHGYVFNKKQSVLRVQSNTQHTYSCRFSGMSLIDWLKWWQSFTIHNSSAANDSQSGFLEPCFASNQFIWSLVSLLLHRDKISVTIFYQTKEISDRNRTKKNDKNMNIFKHDIWKWSIITKTFPLNIW